MGVPCNSCNGLRPCCALGISAFCTTVVCIHVVSTRYTMENSAEDYICLLAKLPHTYLNTTLQKFSHPARCRT
jgi:hypothetical protein